MESDRSAGNQTEILINHQSNKITRLGAVSKALPPRWESPGMLYLTAAPARNPSSPQYTLPSPSYHTGSGWHAHSSHMLTYTNHSASKRAARRCGKLNPQKTQAQEAVKILNITLFQILPFKLEPEKTNSPTKRLQVSALNGNN